MDVRYIQQVVVPEIGIMGQEKIAKAKVLIVGAGGLATPVACYLAACGIGNLGIVDGDKIEMVNLHRQFCYSVNEVGEMKSKLLAKKLSNQNPEIKVTSFEFFMDEKNAAEIIRNFDIICDCTDNANARILIDQTCNSLSKPLVYSAVRDWEGYVTVLHCRKGIKLSDIFSFESLKETAENTCAVSSIVNTTCGIAGSIQATEVIKIILELDSVLDGTIICFNSLSQVFKKYNINKSQGIYTEY